MTVVLGPLLKDENEENDTILLQNRC